VKIELRLFADLVAARPGSRPGDPFEVEIPDEATLAGLLEHVGLATDAVHLVVVNGRIVSDPSLRMMAGDRVSLFPPIGGG
jgi:sulfur carrier protein ThiS